MKFVIGVDAGNNPIPSPSNGHLDHKQEGEPKNVVISLKIHHWLNGTWDVGPSKYRNGEELELERERVFQSHADRAKRGTYG